MIVILFWVFRAETISISCELRLCFFFKFVELFIKIFLPIIEIDDGTKVFGKTCSAINFWFQANKRCPIVD